MRFHRTHKTDGKLLNVGPGVLTADNSTGGTIITPPTGTVTMALRDFYRDPTHPADPVVQRKAGTTAANVTVYYDFTGNPPTQPQGKVTQGGTTIIDWTNLTGIVNHTADGFGVLANVPQGAGYLLHVRDGLQPGNAPTTSDGTNTWGVGVIAVLVGTANMIAITMGGFTIDTVPGTASSEASYYTAHSVPAALFDEFGWHAPANASNYGPYSGSIFQLMRILTAQLQTLYGIRVPVGVVVWTAPATNGLAAFTGPTGAQYLLTIAANGTASGGIGMGSPRNYYGGDFEIILAHHGEADSADTATIYQQKLTAFYASMLAYVLPFGRGANNLYYGLCLPGGYSALPSMETIRQTVIAYRQTAVSNGQSHVDIACDCLDLANDGTVLNTAAGELRAMRRLIQGALQFLGCSTIGASGPTLGSYSISGTVVTFNVVHDGGTALELQSGGAITGFTVNTAADFSGTTITPTSVALANSNTQIAITLPGGTTFPVYVQYLVGANPSKVNPVFDNANYPDGTTGTDIEAVGLPLQPTQVAQRVSNTGLSVRITYAGVQTLFDPVSPVAYNPNLTVGGAFDMGDFTDPEGQFTQGSILVRHNTAVPNLRIFFRTNKTGALSHTSVIFEYGDPWAVAPVRLAYVADIYNGATLLAHYDLTGANQFNHAIHTRWRYKTSDFPIRHDKAWLETNKHIPYMDKTMFGVAPYYAHTPAGTPQVYPMDWSGIIKDAKGPGEREEIGPLDDWTAKYILGIDPESSLRAMAEKQPAAFSIFCRDPATGNMLNIDTVWPLASYNGGTPNIKLFYPLGPGGVPTGPADICNATDDTGHTGNETYIPYLVTGDPYFLENAQFHANGIMLLNPTRPAAYNDGGRYWCWPVRELAYAGHITTATTPAPWLFPKSYFDVFIEGYRAEMASAMDPVADPGHALYAAYNQGSGPDYYVGTHSNTYSTMWQISFVTWVTGWMVMLGYDLFKPMFHTNALMAESLASPIHDYVRGWGVLYNASFAPSAEFISKVPAVRFRAQMGKQMTASISGTTMTVTSIVNGPLVVGDKIQYDIDPNVGGPLIAAFLTGGGGIGTYQLNGSRTLSSRSMWADSKIMLVQSIASGSLHVGDLPDTLLDNQFQISTGTTRTIKEDANTVVTPPTVATGTGGVGTYVMTGAFSTAGMQEMLVGTNVTTADNPPFFIQTESNGGWPTTATPAHFFIASANTLEQVTVTPATGPEGQIGFTVNSRAAPGSRHAWNRGPVSGVMMGPVFASHAAACDYYEIIAQFPQNLFVGELDGVRNGRNYDDLFHLKAAPYQTYERGCLALASRAEFGPGGIHAVFDATEYAKMQAAFLWYETQFRTWRRAGYPAMDAKWMHYPSLPIP